jgi:hypothetical protein
MKPRVQISIPPKKRKESCRASSVLIISQGARLCHCRKPEAGHTQRLFNLLWPDWLCSQPLVGHVTTLFLWPLGGHSSSKHFSMVHPIGKFQPLISSLQISPLFPGSPVCLSSSSTLSSQPWGPFLTHHRPIPTTWLRVIFTYLSHCSLLPTPHPCSSTSNKSRSLHATP